MPTRNIPFGSFLPAVPEFKNPGCLVADNVRPGPGNSYNPIPGPTSTDKVFGGSVISATQFLTFDREFVLAVGTSGTGTQDKPCASPFGAAIRRHCYYTYPAGHKRPRYKFLDFAQYNNFIFATTQESPNLYSFDLRNSSQPGVSWETAGIDPPRANRVARVSDFLMLGDLPDNPSMIAWSSLNNPGGDWAPNRRTQAGTATLPLEFGRIQRIVGGRYALIFQEQGVSRLSYVGPPTVWRVDRITEGRGAIATQSVAAAGYLVYFLAQDGFYVTNGSEFHPIGNERVNRWFFDTVDRASIAQVQGTIDWENSSVVWAFRTSDASPQNNRLIIYSWLYDNWSTATVGTQVIVTSANDAVSFDSDAFNEAPGMPPSTTNTDELFLSPDSSEYLASAQLFSAFREDASSTATNPQSELCSFNGDALEARWETAEFQPSPAKRVYVSEVYPIVEQPSYDTRCALITQDNLGNEHISAEQRVGFNGFCSVSAEGQRIRVMVRQPSSAVPWSNAQGVQVTYKNAGMR